MNTFSRDRIPAGINELIGLFEEDLTGVSFPNVDGDVLRSLIAHVEQSENAAQEAERQLQEAQRALTDSLEALTQRAQQAIAYARVYAEGNSDLTNKITALPAFKPGRKTKARDAARSEKPPKARAARKEAVQEGAGFSEEHA